MALTDVIRREERGEVPGPDRKTGPRHGLIVLKKGQWTKNPASTKHLLYGPMEIEFNIWPSHTEYRIVN